MTRIGIRPGANTSPPLGTTQKLLLTILCTHICLMPWALGTMWWQTQVASLALSFAGLIVALLESKRASRHDGRTPQLIRTPIFWIGLFLSVLCAVQGVNSQWQYHFNEHYWWLEPTAFTHWLPSGVRSPFEKANAWRQDIILTDSWMFSCSVWIGLTRRRSIRVFLSAIAINATLIGALVLAQHVSGDYTLPWAPGKWKMTEFTGPFVYHNHVGAYLAISVFVAMAMACQTFVKDYQAARRSTPAGIWAAGALFLAISVVFTLSRGAALSLGVCALGLALWLVFYFSRHRTARDWRITSLITASVVATLAFVATQLDFSTAEARFMSLAQERTKDPSVRPRILARHAAVAMLKDNWARGVGAGAFRFVFPKYSQAYPEIYTNGSQLWEHAHCDWLEFPIELGLPGDLAIAAALAWFSRLYVKWRAWRSSLAMPLLFGLLATIIHGSFDFPFQCPAVLVLWSAIAVCAGKWLALGVDACAIPVPN